VAVSEDRNLVLVVGGAPRRSRRGSLPRPVARVAVLATQASSGGGNDEPE
jgi:hypothetical protein